MNISEIANGNRTKINFEKHAQVAQLLNLLHDYYDLSWPQIAQLPAINPPEQEQIPIATLAKIAKTGIVPKKWRHRFPGIRSIDNRERISISKTDMNKALKTITNPKNISRANAVKLTKLLGEFYDLPWR